MMFAICFCAGSANASDPLKFKSGPEQNSLLEFYTSEARSESFPAEQWFISLKNSKTLWKYFLPVSFHVSRSGTSGWTDRFTLKGSDDRLFRYTRRWGSGSVYVPTMVVNGTEWSGWSREQEIPRSSRTVGILSAEELSTGDFSVTFVPSNLESKDWKLHAVVTGSDIRSKVEGGANFGRTFNYDFLALTYEVQPMRFSYGIFKATLHLSGGIDIPCKRYALVVWVTAEDDIMPVQATGGYLENYFTSRLNLVE